MRVYNILSLAEPYGSSSTITLCSLYSSASLDSALFTLDTQGVSIGQIDGHIIEGTYQTRLQLQQSLCTPKKQPCKILPAITKII
jgi:hypothetical protein